MFLSAEANPITIGPFGVEGGVFNRGCIVSPPSSGKKDKFNQTLSVHLHVVSQFLLEGEGTM